MDIVEEFLDNIQDKFLKEDLKGLRESSKETDRNLFLNLNYMLFLLASKFHPFLIISSAIQWMNENLLEGKKNFLEKEDRKRLLNFMDVLLIGIGHYTKDFIRSTKLKWESSDEYLKRLVEESPDELKDLLKRIKIEASWM